MPAAMDGSASTIASPTEAPADGRQGRGDGEQETPPRRQRRLGPVASVGSWWLTLALAIVVLPIVVATARALASGWLPLGDNGILLVRARDVGTSHHPLLGSWTSASVGAGEDVNNPGPLYSDLIALPIKLLGPWVGLAGGVMLVNSAAVVFAVVVAARLAGRLTMLSVAAAIAALEWSMGSELLFDVWQPNALVMPALALAIACWGLATGRLWFLPVAVGIGSLLVQTHLSYVYLVAIAGLGAGVMALGQLRTESRTPGEPEPWRRARRPALASVAVAGLAWLQPLIQQFTASRDGNLSNLLDVAQRDTDRLGPGLGLRLLADVQAVPPFWGRPSYSEAIPWAHLESGGPVAVVSLGSAVVAVCLLVTLLVVAFRLNRAASRSALTAMVGIALVLLLGSWVSSTLMPVGIGGHLLPHQMRWLWAVGAFVGASLLATACASVARGRHGSRPWLAGLVAAVGIVAAAAAVPTHVAISGPAADRDALPFAKELAAGLERLDRRGPVLFDTSTLVFAEPYSGLMFAQLQDRGIPFYFEDEVWVRQLGESRRYDDNATTRIWLRSGPGVVPPDELPPGVEEVVSVSAPPDEEGVSSARRVALYAAPVEQRPEA